jgi:hypothetical protein
MAISNYTDLKNELSAYLFHQRLVPRYDNCTQLFETAANTRLRVLPMEASTLLTTTSGDVTLPTDYLLWRTIKGTARPYEDELDYVHPAYLPPSTYTTGQCPRLFTIEANTLKIRPVDDTADVWDFHYYRKIPSLVTAGTNWLLTAYPNAYLYGVLTELAAVQRNTEMAQLYKARRDEAFAEITQLCALTTGATSPQVRTAEYF